MKSFVLFIARHILVMFLVFLAFFLYLASAVTNTGWFLLIASFLVGFIFVCKILSWLNISNLQLQRSFNPLCIKGDKLKIRAEIKNDFFLPSFFVLAKDSIKSLSPKGEKMGGMLDFIGGYSEKSVDYEFQIVLRGLHNMSKMSLISTFPFGLFFSEKKVTSPANLLVLPKTPSFKNISIIRDRVGKIMNDRKEKKNNVSGTDFYAMRNYNSSDGIRNISWPKSAQAGKLIVKDFSSPQGGNIAVYIDEGRDCEVGGVYDNPFEDMLSLAGGISDFAGRNSLEFKFLQDGQILNYRHFDFLNMLAVKKNDKNAQLPDFSKLDLHNTYVFFLSCSPKNVKKIYEAVNMPFSIVFFDALSFGKPKEMNYKTERDELTDLPIFFCSKGEDLSRLFERKGRT